MRCLLLFIGLCSLGLCQEGLRPRELYYVPLTNKQPPVEVKQIKTARVKQTKSAKPAGPQLAARARVIQRLADKSFAGVDEQTAAFTKSDAIRISVEANLNAYVSVLQRGTSGEWSALLPREPGPGTALPAGQELSVPSDDAWTFQGKPGKEQVFVVISIDSKFDVHAVARLLNGGRPDDPVTARLANYIRPEGGGLVPRDLVYEKNIEKRSGTSAVSTEVVTYAVNESGARDLPLMIPFELTHR